jgi:hypothetical protein
LDESEAERGKKTSGYWRITQRGVDFVHGSLRVERWMMVYNDEVLEKSTEFVSIRECLGKEFRYDELMRGGAASLPASSLV